ncbi:copper chaperone PCu(A)C [Bradyrhizobium sp. CIAT3101]|uniref:copper chaperone PCu(A)C n=1 Tax=Bradyrhizobium sp. CIAT3101 TaxID=439387 RepID=UPI0024B242C1|nr:copper chaperone PCu(A)C [Bradyrhizobium sp. CIAT3101]WFU82415.1 copper chaperone PCu(A)C [Bradyrhizobium sp. CIAT3101]
MMTIAATTACALRPTRIRLSLYGVLASIALLVAATSARAGEISVKQAWSRAAPKGAQVAGGYLTIENHGPSPDRLISAATPGATKIEIHEMMTLNGIMVMRPVEDGLTIPPGGSVTLASGSSHLMFIGIKAPFSDGEHIDAVLIFEKAGKIDVTFDVGSIGARGPQMIAAAAAAAAPATSSGAPAPEDFFTHICGTQVMANVTVSPEREGHVVVRIELEDANEQPLIAQALSVTLSRSDQQIAPVTVAAERISADKWRARMPAASTGKWSLGLGIEVANSGRIDIAAPILIEYPPTPRTAR